MYKYVMLSISVSVSIGVERVFTIMENRAKALKAATNSIIQVISIFVCLLA